MAADPLKNAKKFLTEAKKVEKLDPLLAYYCKLMSI